MSDLLPDPETGMELTPAQVAELLPAIQRGEIALIDCREDDEWRIDDIHILPSPPGEDDGDEDEPDEASELP